jgi:hypothetical protein
MIRRTKITHHLTPMQKDGNGMKVRVKDERWEFR